MSEVFEKSFDAGWRDVDPNQHMANSAYLEFAVNTRIACFAEFGFPPAEFQRRGFGPVIKSDLVEYFREIALLENFTVTIESGGLSPDTSRFRIVNCFYKEGRVLAARVTSIGGWLGLNERKLILPPEEIVKGLTDLKRTEDFEVLPSSIKS